MQKVWTDRNPLADYLMTHLLDFNARRHDIRSWLCPLEFGQKQQIVFSERHPRTGRWFLQSPQFRRWSSGRIQNLWCHGSPGSGKTVLASVATEHLRQSFRETSLSRVAVAYCEWRRGDLMTRESIFAVIWNQLFPDKMLSGDVQSLYDRHAERGTKAVWSDIYALLHQGIKELDSAYIVIDALDKLARMLIVPLCSSRA